MIKGFRFTNQLANAEIDARIHQEFLNKNDGIFYGMELSYTNSSVTIAEGLCEIAGRPIAVIDSETVAVDAESLYCLLILEIDLSKESTKDIFNQASFKLLTSSVDYPTVTQQDINKYNSTNTIYQLEFARFRSGTNGITDFKDTRKLLSFSGIYAQIKSDCKAVIEQIKQELASVEDGSAYMLKNNIGILRGIIALNGIKGDTKETGIVQNIQYPTGFNKDNCFVVSVGFNNTSNTAIAFGSLFADPRAILHGGVDKEVFLKDDGITLTSTFYWNGQLGEDRTDKYNFKIVLMKYEVLEDEYTIGDVNSDGIIDEADLQMIQDYITEKIVLTEQQFRAADMDNNGKVSSSDYVLLKNQLGITD